MKLKEVFSYLEKYQSINLRIKSGKSKECPSISIGSYDSYTVPAIFLDLDIVPGSIVSSMDTINITVYEHPEEKENDQKKNYSCSRYAVKAVIMNGGKPENAYIITPPVQNEYQAGLYTDGKYKDIEYQKFDIVRLVEEKC